MAHYKRKGGAGQGGVEKRGQPAARRRRRYNGGLDQQERAMGALLAGGVFDDEGGRASGYARKLFEALMGELPAGSARALNGGRFEELEALSKGMGSVEALLWMADIPNDKPKLVNELREGAPGMRLVISKNNRLGKYGPEQLRERMERAGAAALVEFIEGADGRVDARLWGAGGEVLQERAKSPSELAAGLARALMGGGGE